MGMPRYVTIRVTFDVAGEWTIPDTAELELINALGSVGWRFERVTVGNYTHSLWFMREVV